MAVILPHTSADNNSNGKSNNNNNNHNDIVNNTSTTTNNNNSSFRKKCHHMVSLLCLVTVWWGATAWNSVAAKQVAKANPLAVPWMAFTSNLLGLVGYGMIYMYDKRILQACIPPTTFQSTFVPLSIHHGAGVLCAYMSLTGARVSLVQAVKAMEPLLAMVLSIYFSQQYPSGGSVIAAAIVALGVITVCVSDTTYTWLGLFWGVASSLFTQSRNQYMKRQQKAIQEHNNNPEKINLYHGHQNTMTSLSPQMKGLIMFVLVSAYSLPFNAMLAMLFTYYPPFSVSSQKIDSFRNTPFTDPIYQTMALASVMHFSYNLASFGVLALVLPATHSVANTSKRAVVISAAAIFLTETPTVRTAIGLIVTVAGSVLYAVEQQKQKQKQLLLSSSSKTVADGGASGTSASVGSSLWNRIGSKLRVILFWCLVLLLAFGCSALLMNLTLILNMK